MTKQLAVFTTDHGNYHEAAKHAADLDVRAEMYFPKDCPPNGNTLAELYDLDYWACTPRERQAVIQHLCATPLRRPTALHSYNVSDEEAAALKKNGVVFARRLSRELVQALLFGESDSAAAA